MTKIARQALSAVAVVACAMGMSAPANAVFVARICNDLGCAGGDDVLVQDNAAGDSIGMSGAISFSTSAFGYTLEVNTSQSKPVIGSATAPQLDLSFVVTGCGRRQRLPVRLGHRFPHRRPVHCSPSAARIPAAAAAFRAAHGAARATPSSSSPVRTCSASLGPFTTAAFSASASNPFAPAANPYSLTIGTTVSRTTAERAPAT